MPETPQGAALLLCLGKQHASDLGRLHGPGSSTNHAFLPLLQMSESETLITMVNRMVENPSPRAQLFMQVRSPPGSMSLSASFPLLVHGRVEPSGGRPHPTCPSAGLISQALPGLPPFFTFMAEPQTTGSQPSCPSDQTIQIASIDISRHAGGRISAL